MKRLSRLLGANYRLSGPRRAVDPFLCAVLLLSAGSAFAQEAHSGIDLRATISAQGAFSSLPTQSPRFGIPTLGGYRVVAYPVVKLNEHWGASGAFQSITRPYFQESFTAAGYSIRDNILQGSLNYSRISDKGSLLFRAGILSSAFGSFLPHYDDAETPFTDLPLQYGYYYKSVSTLGIAAVQADLTRGKFDARLQFGNSSPANPRGVFRSDQYGNWTAGAGVTLRQGLRFGASTYRGPYLARDYAFFFPGERAPVTLDARAWGLDGQFAHGFWNLQGEYQSFTMPYTRIRNFTQQAGYVEARRTLSPRWFAAARGGFQKTSIADYVTATEFVAGYRPNRFQQLKFDYEYRHPAGTTTPNQQTFTMQLVTSLHLFSLARN